MILCSALPFPWSVPSWELNHGTPWIEQCTLPVDDDAMRVCNLDEHITGQPTHMITHLDLDLDVVGSLSAILQSKPPMKSATTQHL